MRPQLLLCSALCLAATLAGAATHPRHPALQGDIDGARPARASRPVEPIIGQVLPSAAGGSLVSHGAFLYALMGDCVYKLDPRDLRVVSVQRLGEPRPAATKPSKPVKTAHVRRRRVVPESNDE